MDYFQEIPTEVLDLILDQIDSNSFYALKTTSFRMNKISSKRYLIVHTIGSQDTKDIEELIWNCRQPCDLSKFPKLIKLVVLNATIQGMDLPIWNQIKELDWGIDPYYVNEVEFGDSMEFIKYYCPYDKGVNEYQTILNFKKHQYLPKIRVLILENVIIAKNAPVRFDSLLEIDFFNVTSSDFIAPRLRKCRIHYCLFTIIDARRCEKSTILLSNGKIFTPRSKLIMDQFANISNPESYSPCCKKIKSLRPLDRKLWRYS